MTTLLEKVQLSLKRQTAYEGLTDEEFAYELLNRVWGREHLFGTKSDLIGEAIRRLGGKSFLEEREKEDKDAEL